MNKVDIKKVEKILKEFSELMKTEIESVIIDGVERPATLQDRIEFMEYSWLNASEDLYELGIDTDF